MDTSKLSTGELIAAGAGAVLFISLFLDWIAGTSAFQIFDVVDIILALCALVPVALVVARLSGNTLRLPVDTGRLIVVLGIVATTVAWTFVLESDELDFGIFLSLLAAIALIYGGVVISRAPRRAPISTT